MFKENRDVYQFEWKQLGDIFAGRPNLGPLVSVAIYRLMQYTLRDVLIVRYDPETASKILREAGELAGTEFCKNILDVKLDFNEFISDLQKKLKEFKIGILRFEKSDINKLDFTLTVSEDLDCSGLPMTDETVCEYDEGFISGILKVYTNKDFFVKEIDCWSSGERICRFKAESIYQ